MVREPSTIQLLEFKFPDISEEKCRGLDSREWAEYCKGLSRRNKRWIEANLPKDADHLFVNREGKILVVAYWHPGDTIDRDVRRELRGKEHFMLRESDEDLTDTVLYFEERAREEVIKGLKIDLDDVDLYSDELSGIYTCFGESGLITRMKEFVALGNLKVVKPMRNGRRYSQGATEVEIENFNKSKFNLYIGSQDPTIVHALGLRSIVDQPDKAGKINYLTRLHRFDDPILDIFETWRIRQQSIRQEFERRGDGDKFSSYNPLVLYRHKMEI